MTRTSLYRTLRRLYVLIGATLAFTLLAKLSKHVPLIQATPLETALGDLYEYLKDMSLLIATAGVAYVTNVFQKRSTFVANLEQEWRGIVRTKSVLFAYCEKQYPTADDYIEAFCRLSETIDNMRIVYQNIGETDTQIGLYPFAPLHDMRRALQTIDPRRQPNISLDQKRLVRDAILQSFYALRETFLEELDLETPQTPLLISGARRHKAPGATQEGRAMQQRQEQRQAKVPVQRPDIDEFLRHQYDIEKQRGQG